MILFNIVKIIISLVIFVSFLWWILFSPYSIQPMVTCTTTFQPIFTGRMLIFLAVPIGSIAGMYLVIFIAGKFIRVDKYFKKVEYKINK